MALVFFFFFGFQQAMASHDLLHIYTEVTPGTGFPEFAVVGLVDGEEFEKYDSNIRKMIPKTEWMEKNMSADYWEHQTQCKEGYQETFKNSLAKVMGHFNHTQGVHTLHWTSGCELHDNGTMIRLDQYGYDGEAAISQHLTSYWTRESSACIKDHLDPCIDLLKSYLTTKAALEKKVPPEVTLFQKDSSSPVVCHATGFFPRGVMISWKKNGEELHEDVELRETLPNEDGTFQKRSILRVSPEELDKNNYTCVVQHSGLEKELVLYVADHRVGNTGRRNLIPDGEKPGGVLVGIIVGVVVAVLLVLSGCAGFFIWKKKKNGFFIFSAKTPPAPACPC